MVEIGNISSFLQYFPERIIDGGNLSYFGNAIFDVNIFDVEHIKGYDGGSIYEFQGFQQAEKDELDVILFELEVWSLKMFNVALNITIICVLAYCKPAGSLLVIVDYFSKGRLSLIHLY